MLFRNIISASYFFLFMRRCIVTNFFIIKPTRCTNFPNLFWHETLRVSGSSSVHHQEIIHFTLSTGICHTGLKIAFEQDHPVWHIPVLSVKWINSWWRTEELPETRRVSCQNKFGKLVHLVGFITNKSVSSVIHLSLYAKHFNLLFNYVISYTQILYTPINCNSEIKHHIFTLCLTKTLGNLTQKYNCWRDAMFWLRFSI
jgi:hypothetical protein